MLKYFCKENINLKETSDTGLLF